MTAIACVPAAALRRLALAAALLAGTVTTVAAEHGPMAPRELTVLGERLALNGQGRRRVAWFDVYACALYLPQPVSSRRAVADEARPAAFRVDVLYGEAEEPIPESWREVLRREISDPAFRRLRRAYRELGHGDTMLFAYAPGRGTHVFLNGEHLLRDPGHGLMAALISQWLGPDPVSEELSRALLEPESAGPRTPQAGGAPSYR